MTQTFELVENGLTDIGKLTDCVINIDEEFLLSIGSYKRGKNQNSVARYNIEEKSWINSVP